MGCNIIAEREQRRTNPYIFYKNGPANHNHVFCCFRRKISFQKGLFQMKTAKILIVDDELDMRIFVSTVVETMGFEPITAENGFEALKTARSLTPALVILDVMMPDIDDGIRTYQQFKTEKRLARIPIIILSAIAKKTFLHSVRMLTPQTKVQLPEPEDYMEKPPDAAELVKMIEDLLS